MNQKSDKKKKMCDIARLAGVSPSTVSRALSGSPLVKAQTREKIQILAQQHNYVINKQAQNLRLQSSKTVSVMIPTDHEPRQHVSDPFFLEMLGTIADHLTEGGYELLLSRVNAGIWGKHLMSHAHVDGVIVIGQSLIHRQINTFAEQNLLPMVVWGAKLDDQRYVTVGSDNYEGGRIAGQHLVDKGCKSLAFLGDTSLPEISLRYDGFCKALHDNQQPTPRCIYASCTQSSASATMQKVLTEDFPLDGIFATSDVLASSIVKTLREASIRVPEQVSVVGYDDISLAAYMSPAITSIAQQIAIGGETLVDLLFKQINGEATDSVTIVPKLVIRET